MRGTAPLLVTVLGSIFLRELPSVQMTAGIVLISLGIVSIAFVQRGGAHVGTPRGRVLGVRQRRASSLPTRWSTARARAHPAMRWLRHLAHLSRRHPFPRLGSWRGVAQPRLAYLRGSWRTGLGGGACSLAAYGIVLWAMTRAPIAAVAALRETSVLFAALIGSLWLKEGFGWRRVAGAASVVAGIAALKL